MRGLKHKAADARICSKRSWKKADQAASVERNGYTILWVSIKRWLVRSKWMQEDKLIGTLELGGEGRVEIVTEAGR